MKPLNLFYIFILLGLSWQSLAVDVNRISRWKPKDLTLYLHTVQVGSLVYDNFGHTAIRVIHEPSGKDVMFNWGIFDFSDPISFSTKFYRGHLRYILGIYPTAQSMQRYRRENRTVWQDQFHFTDAEKEVFWQRLVWNLKPENRPYDYQYFFDNCSTRPRDYLDEALGGALNRHTSQTSSGESFRQMVRQHYATNPEVDFALEIIMNSRLDRPMSRWEKMFLPLTLRQELLDFRRDDGTPLLTFQQHLLEQPAPVAKDYTWFQVIFGFGFFCLLAMNFMYLSRRRREPFTMLAPPNKRILGSLVLVYGVISGLFGCLMLSNHLFSLHLDLHHNAQLWLFWPFDLILIPLGLRLIFRAKGYEKSGFLRRYVFLLCCAHVGTYLLLLGLIATGLVHQDLSRSITYLMPLGVIIYGFLAVIHGRQETAQTT